MMTAARSQRSTRTARTRRGSTALALVAGLVALTSACGNAAKPAGGNTTSSGPTVSIPLLSFSPAALSVKVGQTVTWVNGNNIDHILIEGTYQVGSDSLRTSETDDGAFRLSLSKKGDSVRHTYAKAGTFTYYCSIHKGMNAAVTVTS